MVIKGNPMSRRAALRGIGVTIALPLLEIMGNAEPHKTRLVCVEIVHGSAGSTIKGSAKNLWAPSAEGRNFDLSTSSLSPLEPYRDYLTIVSNTDCRNAEDGDPKDAGGDHARSSAVFLTQARPKRTEGPNVFAGTSMDQLYASRFGQDTRIPSLQLCIEPVISGVTGGTGYASVYMDTISWASPTKPLPMERDPRAVFDQLFGVTVDAKDQLSILDFVMSQIGSLQKRLGSSDRDRLNSYLEDIREVERRIQKIEAYNKSGEPRALADSPAAVSDDFEEHVKLMFDLQVQALQSEITRVVAFKMARDGSPSVYPGSGVKTPFHGASHQAEIESSILRFAQINKYHVSMILYFLEKLRGVELLDKTLVLYGSSMGDSNFHNHRRCPLFLIGTMNGALKGNLHVKAPDGTRMANVMLTLLHKLGLNDLETFGDSTAQFYL
jgi:hypothetical protein